MGPFYDNSVQQTQAARPVGGYRRSGMMRTATNILRFPVPGSRETGPGLFGWRTAWRLAATLVRWRRLARQRAALADLEDYLLDDIGLTREEARREARRPFWQSGPRVR